MHTCRSCSNHAVLDRLVVGRRCTDNTQREKSYKEYPTATHRSQVKRDFNFHHAPSASSLQAYTPHPLEIRASRDLD